MIKNLENGFGETVIFSAKEIDPTLMPNGLNSTFKIVTIPVFNETPEIVFAAYPVLVN